MCHLGPKSGVRFVSLPSTFWWVWGSLRVACLWPQPFLSALLLAPTTLQDPSPPGHGSGGLPSGGEQHAPSLWAGLTSGEVR